MKHKPIISFEYKETTYGIFKPVWKDSCEVCKCPIEYIWLRIDIDTDGFIDNQGINKRRCYKDSFWHYQTDLKEKLDKTELKLLGILGLVGPIELLESE